MLGAGARVGEIYARLGGRLGWWCWLRWRLSVLSVYSIDVAENVRATGELGKTAYKQLFFAGVGVMGAVLIAAPPLPLAGGGVVGALGDFGGGS